MLESERLTDLDIHQSASTAFSQRYSNRTPRTPSLEQPRKTGCHAGVLKPALGGNREYFHSQTIGDADRLEATGALNFIQHR